MGCINLLLFFSKGNQSISGNFRVLPVCRRIVRIMEQFPLFPVARGRVLLWMPDPGTRRLAPDRGCAALTAGSQGCAVRGVVQRPVSDRIAVYKSIQLKANPR